jgi:hypothetical protein
MKLSEILKDWPEKLREFTNDHNETNGIYSHSDDGKRYYEIPEGIGFNSALTSCDREIDREALANRVFEQITNLDGAISVNDSYLIADHIISTMPTWLKRIEDK